MIKVVVDNKSNNSNIELKKDDVLYLESKNTEEVVLNINVLTNSNVVIVDYNTNNTIINLHVNNHSYVKYQTVSDNISVNKRFVEIQNDSSVEYIQINTNEVKNDFNTLLMGENASIDARFLSMAKDFNQEINSFVDHKSKHTNSYIYNVGIALKNSNIIFNTTGKIENGFSKCDCNQLSKGIIVDNNATITTRPILLIDEYDVKAYHGSTIGKMSDEELFYLMSRGLSKQDSFLLILSGLINPIINKLSDDELKAKIELKVNKLIG